MRVFITNIFIKSQKANSATFSVVTNVGLGVGVVFIGAALGLLKISLITQFLQFIGMLTTVIFSCLAIENRYNKSKHAELSSTLNIFLRESWSAGVWPDTNMLS
ncbi:MAG: hypothetical protein ACPGJV_14095 [Bacteriovoracaceae bacterium]